MATKAFSSCIASWSSSHADAYSVFYEVYYDVASSGYTGYTVTLYHYIRGGSSVGSGVIYYSSGVSGKAGTQSYTCPSGQNIYNNTNLLVGTTTHSFTRTTSTQSTSIHCYWNNDAQFSGQMGTNHIYSYGWCGQGDVSVSVPVRSYGTASYSSTTSFTYNGSAKTCVTGMSGCSATSGTNSATNAGSYSVTIGCSSDYKFSDGTTSKTVNWSIAKASQSAPTATGATVSYGSTATATASGGTGVGGLEWSNGSTRTAVGSQTTSARWKGNTNYNASAYSNTVTLQVNKASQSAPTATGATVTYGSTATAKASGGGGQGTLTWTNGSTRTAVGSQTTKAYWAGNSNYNASAYSNEVTLKVNQASNPIAVTATQSGTLTFSTSAQDKAFTAATGAQGTVTYSVSAKNSAGTSVSYFTVPTNTTASFRASASTPAGTYTITITASAAGNTNYASGSKTITYTLTINKASQSAPTATGAETTYPNPASATASGGGGQGTLTWKVASGTDDGGSINERTTAGSHTVKAYWAGNSNYNASGDSDAVTVKVNKGTPTLTFDDDTWNMLYDGSQQWAKASASVAGTLYMTLDGTTPSTSNYQKTALMVSNTNQNVIDATSVGDWTVKFLFVPDDSANYNSITPSDRILVMESNGVELNLFTSEHVLSFVFEGTNDTRANLEQDSILTTIATAERGYHIDSYVRISPEDAVEYMTNSQANVQTYWWQIDPEWTPAVTTCSITAKAAPNKIHLILDNGDGDTVEDLYYLYNTESVYSNENLTIPVNQVIKPKKDGYDFLGYYTEDGQVIINPDGTFAPDFGTILYEPNSMAIAMWRKAKKKTCVYIYRESSHDYDKYVPYVYFEGEWHKTVVNIYEDGAWKPSKS